MQGVNNWNWIVREIKKVPSGKTIHEFITEHVKTIDGVRVQTMAVFASAYRWERATWLAHMLDVLAPDHYAFITTPDLSTSDYYNICVLDARLPVDNQVLGYAEPAVNQPLLAHYLKEENNGSEP